ncbi:MAG: TlpA family protein disulfide reductase [Acidobacteria bacterium]|nr:TlpA family protein disulfide reductase [Acidobacteriota bacterium]
MRRRDFCIRLVPAAAAGGVLEAANIPRTAMDVTFTLSGNRQMKLSEYKGKVIAVEFILTYCQHCQRASRAAEAVYREYGPKGFQPVALAIDPNGNVANYVREQNLTFPVGISSQEACVQFMQHPMMLRLLMPQLAFVDRAFQVVAQHAGDSPFFGETEEKNMREMVEKLLKPVSAAPKKAPPRKTT